MEDKFTADKPSIVEMAGFMVIILIFLFFPYKMVSEHLKDVKANSYYAPYKTQ
ncbi:MAG TPA: hypothetical protein VGI43_05250 [Mucilaginibacter sp.]|jgi:hypothetical protein